MEPFTIQCTTCHSRIRVRSSAKVGQVITCPKCVTRLKVALPPKVEFQAPGAAPVDSMALTKEGIVPNLPESSSHSAETEEHIPQTAAQSAFDSVNLDDSTDSQSAAFGEIDWGETEVVPAAKTNWQPEAPSHIPSADWISESTAKKRQVLLVALLGVSGLAVAAVLFMLFLQWYRSEPDRLVAGSPTASAVVSPNADAEARPDAAENPDNNLPQADQLPTGDDDPPTDESGQPNIMATDGDANTAMASFDAPDRPADAAFDNSGANNSDPASTASSNANPNGGELSAGTAGGVNSSENPLADAAVKPAPAVIPKQLQKFEDLLLRDFQPVLPDLPVLPTEAPVTAEELGLTRNGGASSLPAVNWAERSTVTVPALIIGKRRLSQAMNLWNTISGVPSSVDLDSMAAAGLDRNQTLNLQYSKPAELGELSQRFASAAGLIVESQENRNLLFRASADQLQAKLPASISLAGLIDGADELQWLAAALEQLFPGTAGALRMADGKLAVDLAEIDLMTWFCILRMLETWRSQAGMPVQLEGYTAEHLAQPFIDTRTIAAVDRGLTGISPQALPVGQALPQICTAAGVHCWIDWPAVSQVGMGPQTLATVVTNARPLRRALADYCQQFDLVAAILNQNSLWITSTAAYRTQTQVYVVPSAGRTAVQWTQDLREFTPSGPQGIGRIELVLTPKSDFVLVRCCRPSLRF